MHITVERAVDNGSLVCLCQLSHPNTHFAIIPLFGRDRPPHVLVRCQNLRITFGFKHFTTIRSTTASQFADLEGLRVRQRALVLRADSLQAPGHHLVCPRGGCLDRT